MLGAGRHLAAGAVMVTLLAGLASATCRAQDVTLIAQCAPAQLAPPGEVVPAGAPAGGRNDEVAATVACDVRATDAVRFQGVRATVKGRKELIDTHFTAFDPRSRSLVVLFLIQIMDGGRRADAIAIQDAVIRIAEPRDGKQRYAAYSIGNDLNLVADFGTAKADFDKQVRGIRNLRVRTQLFKNALDAIAKLAKEPGERKALIILGDGTYDDPPAGYNHEQVAAAANSAGVVIHALGYFAESADLPQFQIIRRLADATGGFRREVRVGGVQKFAISNAFTGDVLLNGGGISMALRQPPGALLMTISADFAGARSASIDQAITLPAPPSPTRVAPTASEPKRWQQRLANWLANNKAVAVAIGLALALGLAGVGLFAFSKAQPGDAERTAAPAPGAIYGWLDMLDAKASRYPLQTTNVRIGRHRDNDICLQNDSISRRHALLHFNADNRRFVITDLGGNNGVIVNNIKQQSHELNDGDLVELGEVRLRFRSNVETTS